MTGSAGGGKNQFAAGRLLGGEHAFPDGSARLRRNRRRIQERKENDCAPARGDRSSHVFLIFAPQLRSAFTDGEESFAASHITGW